MPDNLHPTNEELLALPPRERGALVAAVRELRKRQDYKIHKYFPDDGPYRRELYPKHMEMFRLGATFKERLFMAGNRTGKTESGAYEVACHLTGLYPPWWEGRRFEEPVDVWACGTNSETTRDIVQAKLFGAVDPMSGGTVGNGMIPTHLVLATVRRPHGLVGSIESAWIQHVSGGKSSIGLKMYEQGRSSFEGTARHVIWDDEEPPEDVYTEQLYRTATTKGITLITFTPLQGMSAVVTGFLNPSAEAAAVKVMINAGWDDVPHLDEKEKASLLATTPPFQREARSKGIPQLGSGAIYAIAESMLKVQPFAIPENWPRWFGLDAGGGAKPTAIVWFAEDPSTKTLYITDVYKRESPELALHVEAIRARGIWMPGVGDAAALVLTHHDAEQLVQSYRSLGVDLILPDKSVETGILDVWLLMTSGTFKVFSSCEPWWEEFRLYHRDEKGRIVKKNDHLMDATRYGVRSGRVRGKVKPPDEGPLKVRLPMPAIGTSETSWMAG